MKELENVIQAGYHYMETDTQSKDKKFVNTWVIYVKTYI